MYGDPATDIVITYLITDVLTHGGIFTMNTINDPKAREAWEAKIVELKKVR